MTIDTVICKEVIISTIKRRGKGKLHSPIRCITEVYDKDGTLIAENDPSPETFTPLDLVHFACYCIDKDMKSESLTVDTIDKWLSLIQNKQQ